MARLIGGRSFNNDSLVIVCEGTGTEYPYFKELCKQYPSYRVVPKPSEVLSKENKSNRISEELLLSDGEASLYTGHEYYVGIAEDDETKYEMFKSEPTRWVRVAQLLQERDKYYEAWVVYDLDKGRDAAHPVAYEMRSDTLHIAFSAYSFEEWFLLHFERNSKAFWESECEDANGRKVNCGCQDCESDINCHGETCIGGWLRERKYIPEYAKGDGANQVKMTMQRRHIAYVNAAWSRTLSTEEVYKRNPYSDVDKLVMRLLRDDYDIKWLKIRDEFENEGCVYQLDIVNGVLIIRYLRGNVIGVIAACHIYWCDSEYNMLLSACSGANFNFNSGKCEAELCNKPEGAAILCITDYNGNAKREYYIKIQ